MNTAEKHWTRFIEHLNEIDPLIFHDKGGQYQLPHDNFLGSIKKYRKIFLEANPEKQPDVQKINVEAPKEYVYIAPPAC